jgi:ABC-2 type transport system permease protein
MNLTVPALEEAPASLDMPRSRLWRAYLIDTKYEFLRMLRSPIVNVPLLGVPVGVYSLFAVILGPNMQLPIPLEQAQLNTFANWMVFGLMGPAMMSFGVGVAGERDTGLLTFKRALPMPPFAYLLSKLVSAVMFACVVIAAMTLINVLFSEIDLTLGQHLRVFGVGILLVLPFCALGLALGTSLPLGAALALSNLAWIGLTMLGGLFFPVPAWLARWVPTYYAGQLSREGVGLPTQVPVWASVAVLAVLAVLCTLLAINRINATNNDR